ncbi:hypothetical protein [Stieleria marina]|uniref:hypothetical protein n=1 Tax=Stieleria marina TaxID=1930275 RepID=UPI003AF3DE25
MQSTSVLALRITLSLAVVAACFSTAPTCSAGQLHAGAAVIDISPTQMPVLVNGGMMSRTVDEIRTTVNARAIVVTDQDDTVAIVVVDSCMVPKEILDEAKQRAARDTDIPADHIMVSATHTHTAPSAFGALGTDADATYVPLLRRKIVDAIVAAKANLQPAKVGWGSADAPDFTALRRWVRRPDRIDVDPFGNRSVRANMHAGAKPENVTGESGPEDPELSVIAFQSTAGKPIAVLCNFSMHYFGDQPISADYFGLFSEGIAKYADAQSNLSSDQSGCVGIMSHGCSGDIWKRDYVTWTGKDDLDINGFTQGLLAVAQTAYDQIQYRDNADIAMAESRLPLRYRVPDAQRLHWAQEIAATIENDLPTTREQVYAREQILLHQMQKTDVVVQAIKIGDIAIATTPNETYALTGLKLKLQSPFKHTMVIELANGAEGYIPPPEQHPLGGYNTWAARSAGLEPQAEPKIVAASLRLLEKISQQPRKTFQQQIGPAAQQLLSNKPLAYYRLDQMQSSFAIDSSGHHNHGIYEPDVLFFLPGPPTDAQKRSFVGSRSGSPGDFPANDQSQNENHSPAQMQPNRCVHFAGGRVRTQLPSLGNSYTVILSFWNGMPSDARPTTGWLFSRDHNHSVTDRGQHLGLGGSTDGDDTATGKLIFKQGDGVAVGKTVIPRWTWNQVKLVRTNTRVKVFLNNASQPEINILLSSDQTAPLPTCFIGGRSDNDSNWEGRIDEVAIYSN